MVLARSHCPGQLAGNEVRLIGSVVTPGRGRTSMRCWTLSSDGICSRSPARQINVSDSYFQHPRQRVWSIVRADNREWRSMVTRDTSQQVPSFIVSLSRKGEKDLVVIRGAVFFAQSNNDQFSSVDRSTSNPLFLLLHRFRLFEFVRLM